MSEFTAYKIPLRLHDGSIIEGTLIQEFPDSLCRLHLTAKGINESASSTDYFTSFAHIRKRLAAQSIFPLCYGASRDIWPSDIARDLIQGLKAYRLVPGEPARELFGIFEIGKDIDPVHPDEQEKFSADWLKSFTK